MFRPKENYDMPDPFDAKNQFYRCRLVDANYVDYQVAMFTLGQPNDTEQPLTRSTVGRALHRAACEANVVGTVYERETKVWKRGCKYDVQCTLAVAIHGRVLAVSEFMDMMAKTKPKLHRLIKPGYKLRSIRALGGKAGDIVGAPRGQRYTRFGRKEAEPCPVGGKKKE